MTRESDIHLSYQVTVFLYHFSYLLLYMLLQIIIQLHTICIIIIVIAKLQLERLINQIHFRNVGTRLVRAYLNITTLHDEVD